MSSTRSVRLANWNVNRPLARAGRTETIATKMSAFAIQISSVASDQKSIFPYIIAVRPPADRSAVVAEGRVIRSLPVSGLWLDAKFVIHGEAQLLLAP